MLNRCLRLLCHNRPIWVWRYSLVTERCSQTMSKGNFTPTPPYDFNWTVVHWYGSNEHWCNNMSRRLLKDVAPTQLLIYSSNNFYRTKRIYINIYIYIYIYSFCILYIVYFVYFVFSSRRWWKMHVYFTSKEQHLF